MKNFDKAILNYDATIKDAVKIINEGKLQVALVVDNKNILRGTITDGDIRRAILSGLSLDNQCNKIMKKNFRFIQNDIEEDAYRIMEVEKIRQIPVLNHKGEIVEVKIKDDVVEGKPQLFDVVIMAGGKGKRLGKLTKKIPKPMLEIAGKPMLEIVIQNCIEAGFKNFFISVNYLKQSIKDHFSDGKRFGINIQYIDEKFSMGTGGSLSLLPKSISKSALVINADVLTKVNLRNLVEFHKENNASITVCSREVEKIIPFGVIETEDLNVIKINEKPVFKYNINAGIYLMNYQIMELIPKNKSLDMTDIIEIAIRNEKLVKIFPIHEYWLDVGIPETFRKANGEW